MDYQPGQLRALAAAALGPRVRAAGEMLAAEMRRVTGTQGVPVARRSLSGEPPRMESTALNKSIQSIYGEFPDRIVASAGSDLPYGLTLEVEMNHPWCLATLKNKADEVKQILGVK